MNTLKIAWLFPDTFYLHGERGNILALERFAGLAGLETETDKIDFDTEGFSPLDHRRRSASACNRNVHCAVVQQSKTV